jgi:hypothetical protein
MNRKSVSLIVLLLFLAAFAHAQTRPREVLRGLKGVYVYVHPATSLE